MNVGKFELEQLSEGHFLLASNGFIERYRPVPGPAKQQFSSFASGFHKLVGIDPLLIKTSDGYVLLDSGLGLGMDHKKRDPATSNLLTNLEVFDIGPDEIKWVVLSHLHHDHVGGLVFTNEQAEVVATLPNAGILAQRLEWEYALEHYDAPLNTKGIGYELDDLFKLHAEGRFRFLEEEYTELMPGIELIRTGGHTPGHQIVRISDRGNTAYYFGDLIPSDIHLSMFNLQQIDSDAMHARLAKQFWLRRAHEENAWIFFYHSPYKKLGLLGRDQFRKFILKESPDSKP